jgi:Fe-S cluster biosynthesis and repair protein YggX
MPTVIDSLIAYKFIKQLSMPWEKWDAYKLGLIDNKGNQLKKAKSKEERKAFPTWQVLIRNIKKLLDKIGASSRLGSFAAALWLLKEEMGVEDAKVLEEEFIKWLETQIVVLNEDTSEMVNILEKGRYIHQETGDVVFLKQDFEAVGLMLNTPIFEIVDFVSGKEYTITSKDLGIF